MHSARCRSLVTLLLLFCASASTASHRGDTSQDLNLRQLQADTVQLLLTGPLSPLLPGDGLLQSIVRRSDNAIEFRGPADSVATAIELATLLDRGIPDASAHGESHRWVIPSESALLRFVADSEGSLELGLPKGAVVVPLQGRVMSLMQEKHAFRVVVFGDQEGVSVEINIENGRSMRLRQTGVGYIELRW